MENINPIHVYIYDSIANGKNYVEIEVKSPNLIILDHLFALSINDTVENLISGFNYEKITNTKYKIRLDNL